MENPERVSPASPSQIVSRGQTDNRRLPRNEQDRADSQAAESSTASVSQVRREAMQRMWSGPMFSLFGTALTATYGDACPEDWITGLADVPGSMITLAIERCRKGEHSADPAKRQYPPNLAGFRALCEPREGDFGLSSSEAAYREAITLSGDYLAGKPIEPSHPAVWHAAYHAGPSLICENADLGRREFLRCWRQATAMVIAGKPLTVIPKALPKPKDDQPRAPREICEAKAQEAMEKINAMFGRKRAGGAA